MSTIQHLFNRSLTIRRKQLLNGFRKDFSTVTASQPAHIQKGTSGSSIAMYGVDRAAFSGWVDISTDVKKNDMIVDKSDSSIYMVVAVIEQGTDTAVNEHKELILAEYPK